MYSTYRSPLFQLYSDISSAWKFLQFIALWSGTFLGLQMTFSVCSLGTRSSSWASHLGGCHCTLGLLHADLERTGLWIPIESRMKRMWVVGIQTPIRWDFVVYMFVLVSESEECTTLRSLPLYMPATVPMTRLGLPSRLEPTVAVCTFQISTRDTYRKNSCLMLASRVCAVHRNASIILEFYSVSSKSELKEESINPTLYIRRRFERGGWTTMMQEYRRSIGWSDT